MKKKTLKSTTTAKIATKKRAARLYSFDFLYINVILIRNFAKTKQSEAKKLGGNNFF